MSRMPRLDEIADVTGIFALESRGVCGDTADWVPAIADVFELLKNFGKSLKMGEFVGFIRGAKVRCLALLAEGFQGLDSFGTRGDAVDQDTRLFSRWLRP